LYQNQRIDKLFLLLALLLLASGLVILGSASIALSQKNTGTLFYYVVRQLFLGGGLGMLALLITQKIPYLFWRRLGIVLMLLSFVLLALVFLPQLSFRHGGASRWVTLGPITFQPSEILKFSFTVYLASWLDARRKEMERVAYGIIPFTLMLSVIGLFLALQPDIGTLGIIVGSAAILYFVGGGKVSQIAFFGVFALILLFLLVQLAPYRLHRFVVFINPTHDPSGIGYQINQALIAIGSGGFLGMGLGRGLQKYDYLPESIGDSIFAVFAEEVGFLGVAALIVLFGAFFWRGMVIAKRAPDQFGLMLGAGFSVMIMLQAFVNMAAISGLLPLTGIPLPFISYGSTSLVMTLAGVGVLLNISKSSGIPIKSKMP
ncbi:MAG: Cell division membrane protein, partial [Parcubacteria group bacterium Gr01-1014_66]